MLQQAGTTICVVSILVHFLPGVADDKSDAVITVLIDTVERDNDGCNLWLYGIGFPTGVDCGWQKSGGRCFLSQLSQLAEVGCAWFNCTFSLKYRHFCDVIDIWFRLKLRYVVILGLVEKAGSGRDCGTVHVENAGGTGGTA